MACTCPDQPGCACTRVYLSWPSGAPTVFMYFDMTPRTSPDDCHCILRDDRPKQQPAFWPPGSSYAQTNEDTYQYGEIVAINNCIAHIRIFTGSQTVFPNYQADQLIGSTTQFTWTPTGQFQLTAPGNTIQLTGVILGATVTADLYIPGTPCGDNCNCFVGRNDNYPRVLVTASWTGGRASLNYLACNGGGAWQNGQSREVCPNVYSFTPGGITTYTFYGFPYYYVIPTQERWQARMGPVNNARLYMNAYRRLGTPYFPYSNSRNKITLEWYNHRVTIGNAYSYFGGATAYTNTYSYSPPFKFSTWSPLATALIPRNGTINNSFFGQFTTIDGVTITWQRVLSGGTGRTKWAIEP